MGYRIGLVCATDSEAAPFLAMLRASIASVKAGVGVHTGFIGQTPVCVAVSGVCRVNAAIATQVLIDNYGCNAIINAGASGGMDERLRIFDTVISSECAYWDMAPHTLCTYHPYLTSAFFPAGEALLAAARRAADGSESPYATYFGRMVTGEQFVVDENRAAINARYAPLCVDMETAGIAQVCHAFSVPYLAVRTVTDTADHSGEAEFAKNCVTAARIAAGLTCAILAEL